MKANQFIHRIGLLGTGILLSVSLTTASAAENDHVAKFVSCKNLTKDQIAAQVKQDFLQNRIHHWDKDRKQLGTSKPIAWVNVNDMTGDRNALQVPLIVRGSQRDKSYNVTIDCQKDTINYSEVK
ncbi:protein YebF [Xenorhabdus bovienii]|uniref:Protein yebF n=6 Tax=Xenorhabdus bovienii TaxID=40576 RepID=A0A077PCL3_XENBV|nr:protein YebF [Xenorhabdus bovienii]MCG3471665.1 protein YebF [Xenorhabdus bovienii]MDE1473489.1 protein YebF [Xenorhabdus bovienii]MDE1479302.1 protein YebF [Xenorhabdus bovienii]MDE1481370.1 protein YebF [Xenorhabdus bovienii]MDE1487310.1 protein YebF [Xenorhabdus bovienii]